MVSDSNGWSDERFIASVRGQADEIWRFLESKGAAGELGGSEYCRRIVGLRQWLAEDAWLDSSQRREPMPPQLLAGVVGRLDANGRLLNAEEPTGGEPAEGDGA